MTAPTKNTEAKTSPKRPSGPRLTHILYQPIEGGFADMEPFGQELDALRALTTLDGWRYVALPAGTRLTRHLTGAKPSA